MPMKGQPPHGQGTAAARYRRCGHGIQPKIFPDSAMRFMNVKDENLSAEVNEQLSKPSHRLIGLGAEAVMGIHHERKL